MSYETLEAAVQSLINTNSALVTAVTNAQTRVDGAVASTEADAAAAAQSAQSAAGQATEATEQAGLATTKAELATTKADVATAQAGLSAESAVAAATQAASAELFAEAAGALVFASYADAQGAMGSLADGDVVRIIADELVGGQGTYRRFSATNGASLVLDFVGDSYGLGGLILIRTEHTFALVPSTAASAGIQGQLAANSTHLYVCVADNSWKRTALEVF